MNGYQMPESNNSLKKINGKIFASNLTGYDVGLKGILSYDCFQDGYFINRINADFQKYSIEAAYQYKIIKKLTKCSDLKSIPESKIADFYIGMGNFFYKTIPELILGNLLFSNGIDFSFDESYEGMIKFAPNKTSTFTLPDVGVVIDLEADMSGFNDDINIDCRYQELNPFNPLNEYLNTFGISGTFTLEKFIDMLYSTLIEHEVHIEEETLDLGILAPYVAREEGPFQPELKPFMRLCN